MWFALAFGPLAGICVATSLAATHAPAQCAASPARHFGLSVSSPRGRRSPVGLAGSHRSPLCVRGEGRQARVRNIVKARVRGRVRRNRRYTIALVGYARDRDRVYLFVDYKRCARTPSQEHARASGEIWYVSHRFTLISRGWRASRHRLDHACGYLQDAAVPTNAGYGLLARTETRFRVQ
jgi:hypothetical protein